MEYIEWSKDYSVNVKLIDDQHKHFVGIMNLLYKKIQSNKTDRIPEIIDEPVSYAETHFETEEKYFKEFNYDGTDEHKMEHNKLKERVSEFLSRKNTDSLNFAFELLDFLENWLVDHLANMDKKYTQCFNDHGLY